MLMLFVFSISVETISGRIYSNLVSSVVQLFALNLNDFRQPVDRGGQRGARRHIKLMAANKISASCH